MFELHSNANISSSLTKTRGLLGSALRLQGASAGGGASRWEESVTELCEAIEQRIPKPCVLCFVLRVARFVVFRVAFVWRVCHVAFTCCVGALLARCWRVVGVLLVRWRVVESWEWFGLVRSGLVGPCLLAHIFGPFVFCSLPGAAHLRVPRCCVRVLVVCAAVCSSVRLCLCVCVRLCASSVGRFGWLQVRRGKGADRLPHRVQREHEHGAYSGAHALQPAGSCE